QDIDKVKLGMDATVRFTGLNYRWNSPLSGKVIVVGADKITNDKMNPPMAFYRADIRIDPKDLTGLSKRVRITPGMPASVMIKSGGDKSVMGTIISPITDTMRDALHDQ